MATIIETLRDSEGRQLYPMFTAVPTMMPPMIARQDKDVSRLHGFPVYIDPWYDHAKVVRERHRERPVRVDVRGAQLLYWMRKSTPVLKTYWEKYAPQNAFDLWCFADGKYVPPTAQTAGSVHSIVGLQVSA